MRPWLIPLLLAIPGTALAQGDCFPDKDSHEASAFAILGVPLAFGPASAPASRPPWSVQLAIETSYLPNIDDSTATPTICRAGKGPENTDFATLLPRPRLLLGLPGGLSLEASWIPPITVNGAEPNVFGASLGRSFMLGTSGMLLGLRLHATTGVIHAPITCDEEALMDTVSECFNGMLSNDEYHPNSFGADASVGWSLGGGSLQPFLGGGYNVLHPRFRVNFTNQFGQTDRRRVAVDLNRAVLFAGVTWFPVSRFGVSGQIYSAPSDAVTGRITLSYGLGGH
ncbi:MAG: hypothetical protein ABI613_02005 [Gemmatimonadota bacterium]